MGLAGRSGCSCFTSFGIFSGIGGCSGSRLGSCFFCLAGSSGVFSTGMPRVTGWAGAPYMGVSISRSMVFITSAARAGVPEGALRRSWGGSAWAGAAGAAAGAGRFFCTGWG